jgi:hypothetical protein
VHRRKGREILHPTEDKAGKLATCGVNLHTKKAIVKQFHNYYTESAKQLGYTKPALDINYDLALDLLAMRSSL